jgi:hypothetical protein
MDRDTGGDDMRGTGASDIAGPRVRRVASKPGLPHAGVVSCRARSRTLVQLHSVGIVLCLSLALAAIGCGPGYPPNNYIIDPPIAFDGLGNIYTAYQINQGGGPITYLQKLGPDGERLWGEKGIRLDERQPEPQTREEPRPSATYLISDQEGCVTVFWVYDHQLFAKKLDGSGNPIWTAQPLAVGYLRGLVERSGGGVTIAWIDSDDNLCLQAVDGDGNLLWPDHPYIADVAHFDIARDADGSTWVLWAEPYTESIKLQVFDRSGRALWSEAREVKPGVQAPGRSRFVRRAAVERHNKGFQKQSIQLPCDGSVRRRQRRSVLCVERGQRAARPAYRWSRKGAVG